MINSIVETKLLVVQQQRLIMKGRTKQNRRFNYICELLRLSWCPLVLFFQNKPDITAAHSWSDSVLPSPISVLRALQEENADLHQNLLQTVVCIESLEAELQRTRDELSHVKEKYKRWIVHIKKNDPEKRQIFKCALTRQRTPFMRDYY